MRTLLLLFAMIFICSTTGNTQKLVFLFGHAEYANAVGDLKNLNDNGIGGEAGIGVGVGKTFFVGTIGTTFLSKANNSTAGTLRYTPLKAGIRRYIVRKNIFVKADAGMANMKYSKHSDGSTKFTSTFGAGVKFTGVEAIADFTNVANFGSWISLKAGFTLGI